MKYQFLKIGSKLVVDWKKMYFESEKRADAARQEFMKEIDYQSDLYKKQLREIRNDQKKSS